MFIGCHNMNWALQDEGIKAAVHVTLQVESQSVSAVPDRRLQKFWRAHTSPTRLTARLSVPNKHKSRKSKVFKASEVPLD